MLARQERVRACVSHSQLSYVFVVRIRPFLPMGLVFRLSYFVLRIVSFSWSLANSISDCHKSEFTYVIPQSALSTNRIPAHHIGLADVTCRPLCRSFFGHALFGKTSGHSLRSEVSGASLKCSRPNGHVDHVVSDCQHAWSHQKPRVCIFLNQVKLDRERH